MTRRSPTLIAGALSFAALFALCSPAGSSASLRPAGRIFTIAGGPRHGYAGDGRLATLTRLRYPAALATTPTGGFLFGEGSRVRELGADGVIRTVAGSGTRGFAGDGGPATAASLSSPGALATLPDGGFLIADTGNGRVRRVWPNGTISTVAGNGSDAGPSADGGPATSAWIDPAGVDVLADGSFLIADRAHTTVRMVDVNGIISTVAGGGTGGDGEPATNATLCGPVGVSALSGGGFLIDDGAQCPVRRVTADGTIHSFGRATGGSLSAMPDGGYVWADEDNRVRRRLPDGHSVTLAGRGWDETFAGDGGLATRALLNSPESVVPLPGGGFVVSDSGNHRIRLIASRTGNPLALAVRPADATVTAHGYTVGYLATRPGTPTLEIFRGSRRVAKGAGRTGANGTAHASGHFRPGLYTIRITVRTSTGATAAGNSAVLGGALPSRLAVRIAGGGSYTRFARATTPTPVAYPADDVAASDTPVCHRFSSVRVDCEQRSGSVEMGVSCDAIEAMELRDNGQVMRRYYRCPTRRDPGLFKFTPRWFGKWHRFNLAALRGV